MSSGSTSKESIYSFRMRGGGRGACHCLFKKGQGKWPLYWLVRARINMRPTPEKKRNEGTRGAHLKDGALPLSSRAFYRGGKVAKGETGKANQQSKTNRGLNRWW